MGPVNVRYGVMGPIKAQNDDKEYFKQMGKF